MRNSVVWGQFLKKDGSFNYPITLWSIILRLSYAKALLFLCVIGNKRIYYGIGKKFGLGDIKS